MKPKGPVVRITWTKVVNGGCDSLRVVSIDMVGGRAT